MANTEVTEYSIECDIDITIEKYDSELIAISTTNVNDAIKPDSKMPAHQSNHVFHLPYATIDTEICSEEKEEDKYIEWGHLKVDERKYKRKKEPLFIGDTVQYYHPLWVYGSKEGLQVAVVTSFDWDGKTVSLNSMLTQGDGDSFRLRRINGYHEDLNKRIDQDGLTRYLEEFEWKLLPDEAENQDIKHGHHVMAETIQKYKLALKRKLNEDNNLYAGFLDHDEKRGGNSHTF